MTTRQDEAVQTPTHDEWREACERSVFDLSEGDLVALRSSVDDAHRSGLDFSTWGGFREWRPSLQSMTELLGSVRAELTPASGSGVAIVRGFPVDLDLTDVMLMYWAFGAQLGVPTSQNAAGDFLVHVREQAGNRFRGYRSAKALSYHCDFAEIAGLLCIRPAAEGGHNSLVSSNDLYQAVASEAPQLIGLAHQEFPFGRLNEQTAGEPRVSRHPIAAIAHGRGLMWYSKTVITQALTDHSEDFPPLSDEQERLLEVIETVSQRKELQYEYAMNAGDLLLLNDSMVLHSRTAFKDHGDPAEARHSIRMWIEDPDSIVPEQIRHPYVYGNLGVRAW